MRRHLSFFVAGIPASQGSMRAFVPKGWTRAVVTHNNSAKLRAWRKLVALCAAQQCASVSDAPIAADLEFFLSRPKSLRDKNNAHCVRPPDLDKLVRAVLDSLKGVAWHDDAQVVSVRARKRYAVDGRVGCQIEIRTVSEKQA